MQLPGLSPHGRGKLLGYTRAISATWSIPARAGETFPFCRRQFRLMVYPRTGGGNQI